MEAPGFCNIVALGEVDDVIFDPSDAGGATGEAEILPASISRWSAASF